MSFIFAVVTKLNHTTHSITLMSDHPLHEPIRAFIASWIAANDYVPEDVYATLDYSHYFHRVNYDALFVHDPRLHDTDVPHFVIRTETYCGPHLTLPRAYHALCKIVHFTRLTSMQRYTHCAHCWTILGGPFNLRKSRCMVCDAMRDEVSKIVACAATWSHVRHTGLLLGDLVDYVLRMLADHVVKAH